MMRWKGDRVINNFSDHAANERTFLAWVRSAIAVMAFGFLVERFDLFLVIMGRSTGTATPAVPSSPLGHIAGLVLIIAGIVMVVISAVRFVFIGRMIDSPRPHSHFGTRADIALAVMLGLLGIVLYLYLSHAIGPKV
jgi:putative membrane protein